MGIRPEDIDDEPEFMAKHPTATWRLRSMCPK